MSSRTRGAKQIFYNVASHLPHLPLHAITDDEVLIYRQFLENILQRRLSKKKFEIQALENFSKSHFICSAFVSLSRALPSCTRGQFHVSIVCTFHFAEKIVCKVKSAK